MRVEKKRIDFLHSFSVCLRVVGGARENVKVATKGTNSIGSTEASAKNKENIEPLFNPLPFWSGYADSLLTGLYIVRTFDEFLRSCIFVKVNASQTNVRLAKSSFCKDTAGCWLKLNGSGQQCRIFDCVCVVGHELEVVSRILNPI